MTNRTGRRPGPNMTRAAILSAATRQFSELGYDRATMRSIANEAGVDPALVLRFYKSKQQLFMHLTELPFDAASVLPKLLGGARGKIGERTAQFIVGLLENEEGRSRMTSLIRAATIEPAATDRLREELSKKIYTPLAEGLGSDKAELRGNLVGSQIVGLIMARYVLAIEPLASCSAEHVIALIAPTLQRYLTAPLP